VGLIALVAVYTHFLADVQAVPLKRSLSSIPPAAGDWQGASERMTDEIRAATGVEDYLLRDYRKPGSPAVNVYVGYYEKQQEGDQAHSPKHCLPGSGWNPVQNDEVVIPTPGFNGGSTRANRYLIEKGGQQELVLYWYQGRGRPITGDYEAKVRLVLDSIFRKRTDGALVRFTSTLAGASPETAQARIEGLAESFLPQLAGVLPD
jgi:EpsI family protein